MNVDKNQVARQFTRAAATYDRYAALQWQMAERLLSKLQFAGDETVVDLGCGTGQLLAQVANRYPHTTRLGIDLAEGMIGHAREAHPEVARWICADLESPPLADEFADTVVSNAAIQWCDSSIALQQMQRILKPGGRLLLSTFARGTLQEIHQAWQSLGLNPPVHQLPTCQQWQRAMIDAGLEVVDMEVVAKGQAFDSIKALLQSLRGVGATYAGNDRARGLLTRQRWRDFSEQLAKIAGDGDRFVLTYECIFATAVKTS